MAAPMEKIIFRKYSCFLCIMVLIGADLVHMSIDDIEENNLESLTYRREFVLAYFYKDNCPKCVDGLKQLQRIEDSHMLPDLQIIKVYNKPQEAEKYSISSYPTVVFFRDGNPVMYPVPSLTDGDDVVVWMEQNRRVSIQTLKDSDFEHLTQASSGATTGDWFVLFYQPECSQLMAKWDSVANSLKHRLNTAKVDISANTGLQQRFDITKCPSIYYFRAGSMYRYDLKDMEIKTFISFADGFYKNMKAVKVPGEPSPFDSITENIANIIKGHVEGPNGQVIVFIAAAAFLLLIIIGVYISRSPQSQRHKFE